MIDRYPSPSFPYPAGGSSDPDLQIRFVPGYALDKDAIQSYVRFDEIKKEKGKWPAGVTMQLLTARPASRGRVGLKSANPFDLAQIDLGYFTDAGNKDLETLINGVKIARNIAAQSPLGSYLSEEGWPGSNVQTGGGVGGRMGGVGGREGAWMGRVMGIGDNKVQTGVGWGRGGGKRMGGRNGGWEGWVGQRGVGWEEGVGGAPPRGRGGWLGGEGWKGLRRVRCGCMSKA